MKRIFYAIFYQPQINFLLRNLVRAMNDVLGTNIRFSVSGKIKMVLGGGKHFHLALNESSAAHIYFWERAINFEFTPIFMVLAKRCRVFLDIGSNIGFYTGVANVINPEIKIWAFEPADGPHHYVCKNKVLNNWVNTQIFKVALSNQQGEITFFEGKRPKYGYLKYHLSGIGATANTHNLPNMMQYTVPTDTLDHFVEAQAIPTIDIIKMDTEATEHMILEKGYATLQRDQPIIICEVLFGKVEREIEHHIKALGMHMFEQVGRDLVPTDTLAKAADNMERSYFFVPESKLDWIREFIKAS